MSIFSIPCSFIWSLSESLPSIPPKIKGCNVFTLPPIISGKFVTSSTGRTGMPASDIAFEVPPVETISIPFSESPFDKSTIPDLSLTLINTLDILRRDRFSLCSTLTTMYYLEVA